MSNTTSNESYTSPQIAEYPAHSKEYSEIFQEIANNPQSIAKYTIQIQEWLCDDDIEMFFEEKKCGLSSTKEVIAHFIPLPVKVDYSVDYGNESQIMKNCIIHLIFFAPSIPPKKVIARLEDLNYMDWIESNGIEYRFKTKELDRIKCFITAIAQHVPKTRSCTVNGWITEENSYCLDGKFLKYDDKNEVDTQEKRKNCDFVFKMLDVAPHNITIPLLSTCLLSLIHTPMKEAQEFFRSVVVLYGQTQSKKTTLAKLFFNLTEGRVADTGFSSTEIAMVRTLSEQRDKVTIIDDAKPAASRGMKNEILRKFETILRLAGDDNGGYKTAITKHGKRTTIAFECQGIPLITAEDIPITVASSLARLFVIEMSRDSVDVAKLTYAQHNRVKYLGFIVDYIINISKIGVVAYSQQLKEAFLKYRSLFREEFLNQNFSIDERNTDVTAFLYLSFIRFIDYAVEIGSIDASKAEEYTAECKKLLFQKAVEQSEGLQAHGEIEMFFAAIREMVDTGEEKIQKIHLHQSGYNAEECDDSIGFNRNDEYIFLKTEKTYHKVRNYYQKQDINFPVTETTLRLRLANQGYLIKDNPRLNTTRIKVNKHSFSCIKLEKLIFEKLTKGVIKNEYATIEREISDYKQLCRETNSIFG